MNWSAFVSVSQFPFRLVNCLCFDASANFAHFGRSVESPFERPQKVGGSLPFWLVNFLFGQSTYEKGIFIKFYQTFFQKRIFHQTFSLFGRSTSPLLYEIYFGIAEFRVPFEHPQKEIWKVLFSLRCKLEESGRFGHLILRTFPSIKGNLCLFLAHTSARPRASHPATAAAY